MGLSRFPILAPDELLAGLAAGTLLQSDTTGFFSCPAQDETRCLTSSLLTGTYSLGDVWYAEGGVYLVNLSAGDATDYWAQLLAVLSPTPGSAVTEVMLEPACGDLEIDIDLAGAELSPDEGACVTVGAPSWPIDWSALEADVSGGPIDRGDVDTVVVSRFEVTLDEVEAGFWDRDVLAAERFNLALEQVGTEFWYRGPLAAAGVSHAE